jgi:hypothetical protein
MLLILVLDSPYRGSEVFDITTILSSGDIQLSETVVIGRSLPTVPMGKTMVVRDPSAKTPSKV